MGFFFAAISDTRWCLAPSWQEVVEVFITPVLEDNPLYHEVCRCCAPNEHGAHNLFSWELVPVT